MNPKRTRRADTVPVHSLYGEPTAHVVDFLHIERIRSRSELFDWLIDPHKHPGLAQVMLVLDGAVHVSLDETTRDLPAPAVITTPPGVVHSFDFVYESAGFVITVADDRLETMAMGRWIRERLFVNGLTLALDTGDAVVPRLRVLCEELFREHEAVDTGRVPIMESIVLVILTILARKVDTIDALSVRRRPHDRFREFRAAVEDHYADHWPLGRYADLLHMSESSLNRVCRAVAGVTAFEIVQGRLELEARRRLIYTAVPVHRLATELGFVDPSYFSRFFRRRTGTTPNEFRRFHQPM
ncbi:MAG: helix-turn-helix domain-containing protein [Acidimicrobiia bacterium]